MVHVGGSEATAALAAATVLLPSMVAAVDAHRERNGDKSPLPTSIGADGDKARERRVFETSAFYRAVNKVKAQLSFEDFVTEMANCSNVYGRRFSVTCVRIAGLTECRRTEIADLLRKTVRASDEIRLMNDEEFLVCTPLLSDAKDADLVLNRLRRALLASQLLEDPSTLSLGRALHPLDGYSGRDLIEAARNNCRPSAPDARVEEKAKSPSA